MQDAVWILSTQILISIMAKAGCTQILFGVESHGKNSLQVMGKRILPEQQMKAIRWTLANGILPILSFVVGCPEDSLEDLEATANFILDLPRDKGPLAVHIHMLSLIPGTDFHRRYGGRLVRKFKTSFGKALEFDNGELLTEDDALTS